MLEFRKSTPEDAYALAPRLRKEDLAELYAAGALGPSSALLAGQTPGATAVTVGEAGGFPLMMFGVVQHPQDPLIGLVWALASEGALRHRKAFLREGLWWIERFQDHFPVLSNFTDCRNSEHHRWLRWCGFTFINKINGPRGHPFFEFVRIRSEHV